MNTKQAYLEAWQLQRLLEKAKRGDIDAGWRHSIRGLFRELPFGVQSAAIASYANRDAFHMYDGASLRQQESR